MEYAVALILLSLLQYSYFAFAVGTSRAKHEVSAPKISGDEIWERSFRVQQNTLEQLIIFIPGMLAFSYYVSNVWVIVPGVTFLIARQIYAHLYVKDPTSRAPGFVLGFFANMVLVFGSLISIGLGLAS